MNGSERIGGFAQITEDRQSVHMDRAVVWGNRAPATMAWLPRSGAEPNFDFQ
jgi:hypothetical protein